jgi:hypothetical protein
MKKIKESAGGAMYRKYSETGNIAFLIPVFFMAMYIIFKIYLSFKKVKKSDNELSIQDAKRYVRNMIIEAAEFFLPMTENMKEPLFFHFSFVQKKFFINNTEMTSETTKDKSKKRVYKYLRNIYLILRDCAMYIYGMQNDVILKNNDIETLGLLFKKPNIESVYLLYTVKEEQNIIYIYDDFFKS